jgi:hypothetical protein
MYKRAHKLFAESRNHDLKCRRADSPMFPSGCRAPVGCAPQPQPDASKPNFGEGSDFSLLPGIRALVGSLTFRTYLNTYAL